MASRGTGSAPTALPPPPAVPRTIARVERGRASPRTPTVAGDVAQNVTFCWRYEPAEGTTVACTGLRPHPGLQKMQRTSRWRAPASASDGRLIGTRAMALPHLTRGKKHNNQPDNAEKRHGIGELRWIWLGDGRNGAGGTDTRCNGMGNEHTTTT